MNCSEFAQKYDRALAPFEKRFLGRWRRETLSYLPENAEILEIGAGTGANFKFYPSTKRAVAFDISDEMLKTAFGKKSSVNLLLADAERLPFPENSFDAAFATLVFCSVPNPENAFRQLQKVVRPRGRIILLEHVRPKGLLGYVFDAFNFAVSDLVEDRFNRETAKTVEKSGLKILEIKQKAFGIVNLIVCEVVK